jgi:hypothetical protein
MTAISLLRLCRRRGFVIAASEDGGQIEKIRSYVAAGRHTYAQLGQADQVVPLRAGGGMEARMGRRVPAYRIPLSMTSSAVAS